MLAAADFEDLLVRPSRSVFEAALAAFLEVCRFGVPVWDKALPADALDDLDVDFELSVFDALLAALRPVVFLLAMYRFICERWNDVKQNVFSRTLFVVGGFGGRKLNIIEFDN